MRLETWLGALSERPFRLLWLARTTSALGDRMAPVAFTFAVLELGGSGTDLGLVLAASLLPNVLLVLAGGVAGDRWPRSRVMVASDLARALSQGAVAALLLAGRAEIWHLAVSGAVWGAAAAFFAPASTGVVPEVVSAQRLQQANALMGLSRNVVGVWAPAVAGVIIAAAGAGTVLAVDAATFAVSGAFLLALPLAGRVSRPATRFATELAEGWREVTGRRWLWVSILAFCGWNAALAAFFVLGPLVVEEELRGAADWGLIMAGSAAGAIAGGVVALRWKPQRPLVVVFGVTMVSALQLLLLVPPAPVAAMVAAAAAAMVGVSVSMAVWTTTLQEQIPEHALSRVTAYDWLGSLVVMPVAYAVVGPISEAAGLDRTLVAAAALMVGSGLVALAVPDVRAMRRGRPA